MGRKGMEEWVLPINTPQVPQDHRATMLMKQ